MTNSLFCIVLSLYSKQALSRCQPFPWRCSVNALTDELLRQEATPAELRCIMQFLDNVPELQGAAFAALCEKGIPECPSTEVRFFAPESPEPPST